MERIMVELMEGALGAGSPWAVPGAGAVLSFEGVVRPQEAGRELGALRYEVYEPMTGRELRKLAERTVAEHGLLGLAAEHSVGRVKPGEVSFRLRVASRHRAEGLVAMDAFITTMKQQVPIWKNPEWAGVGEASEAVRLDSGV